MVFLTVDIKSFKMKTLFLLILFVTQAFGAAVVDPKQQRFTELTAVLNQNFDDQTLDSLDSVVTR